MSGDTILVADGIDVSYGRLQVLFGVSLEVRRGEALALLGTTGAGKSTLLKAIAGLVPISAGRVTIGGRDITNLAAERVVHHRLVLIPGGRAVFTDMTVAENIEMQALSVRGNRGRLRERRATVFETFPRLYDRLGQTAGTLSGGEQPQLALAKGPAPPSATPAEHQAAARQRRTAIPAQMSSTTPNGHAPLRKP